MSGVKRLMESNEHAHDITTAIAVEAEVLEYCDNHGVYFSGCADIEAAFELAKEKFESEDSLVSGFNSIGELKEAISNTVEENAGNFQCEACEEWKHS